MAAGDNYKKMMSVIDSVFETRHDPDQLQVTPKQMKKLQAIHPSALSEKATIEGPVIWVLMIPTTELVMHEFIAGTITEKQLLEKTEPGISYHCLYLCSATTLPEYRGKGDTRRLCMDVIANIRKDHFIKTLFVWPFTNEGEKLATSIAKECGLDLLTKKT